ncbi:MAG TPA: right-handed parallel beta-helix repeat-containing protein [Bryobacteraceae bacterium]|nr:right-handed parallel beta-helix repeat-containing protein [Bryobacteraceae bacterium]
MKNENVCIIAMLACSVLPLTASGANLCVSARGHRGPANGCYSRIADAISAAAPFDVINVESGTYREAVVITKPLSLVGNRAIVEAAGLSRGIFVDGLNTPNLAGVNVSGFTVQNANFEGILVANASAVTISSNAVYNNNKSLAGGACPGLEAFEPGEQMDCGEGIHVLGADHSIVTNNTVEGNAGGILLSDDTGPAHDNLVSFNLVRNNPFACGITMASHAAASISGSAVPLGVYHNTIYANRSTRNGNGVGGGSGIGIFASVPDAKSYGNVVVNNFVSDNGHPGISMHAHVPGQNLDDNMVVGNTIMNNGTDTGDAATPGTTGINVYAAGPVTGNIISGNSIQKDSYDVVTHNPALVQVQFNNLWGLQYGLSNLGNGPVYATNNFWGCPLGPIGIGSCSSVEGSNVETTPWLKLAIPTAPQYYTEPRY